MTTRLVSIVISTWNRLELTQRCLRSIYKQEYRFPFEVVLIDNGSTDGTREWLKDDIRPALERRIFNDDNRGAPVARNQGLRAAVGDVLSIIDNDVEVSSGCLEAMISCLESDPKIGIVGPMSDYSSGPQKGTAPAEKSFALERIVGFCWVFRRSLVDAIGYLDERFWPGQFEDDDYCRRAVDAGFVNMVAAGAHVHHEGGKEWGNAFAINRDKYEDKWRDNRRRD